MVRCLLIVLLGLLASCKQEVKDDAKMTAQQPAAALTQMAKEGFGKVTLECGAQTLTVEGKCGGTTALGDMVIAVQDKTTPTKVFTITFNGKDYPESGKVYTIKKSDFMDQAKKSASDIYVAFSEINQKNQMDWSSDDQSGTISFQANGNEITCTFKDIKLQPSIVYNKAGLDQAATASGTMTFYKN